MRDWSYGEAIERMTEQITPEDLDAAARVAECAGMVLGVIGEAAASLADFVPPTPEMIAEFDRKMTILLWRHGLIK